MVAVAIVVTGGPSDNCSVACTISCVSLVAIYSPSDLAICSIGELVTGVCSLPLESSVSLELSVSSELLSPLLFCLFFIYLFFLLFLFFFFVLFYFSINVFLELLFIFFFHFYQIRLI